ncbi:unnamed protein product [Diamesa hyperborea]
MKTYFIILCAALLIGTAISVKPAHPEHPGHPGHPGQPAHPANPANPQNPRFSLFEPIVFYPFAAFRAFVVTVVTIVRVILQCVFAYLRGAKPSMAAAVESFNSTAISCMAKINETESFDPKPASPAPTPSPNPTLNEMCDDDDSGRVFDSTSKDIAFDGVEQTHYYISGQMNLFAGYRPDEPQYAFDSPQFRPPPPPAVPVSLPYAKSGDASSTTCATVSPASVYYQATHFIDCGKALKQNVIDLHSEIQEIKSTTGIDCECSDFSLPATIKQITDDIEAINVAMVYNQYYYYSYAAMVTVSSASVITKMENSIKKCETLVSKVRDAHVKVNSEIKEKKDKSYKKLKEDKKSGAITDDKYCEGVRKQNSNSRKHGRKHAHNGFRKNRRNRENKEKNVKKARKIMVENWKKTVQYFDTTTYYVYDWLQIIKPKLTSLSGKFKTMTDDMERIFSNREKRRNHVHKESNDSYVIHSDKHHREHERCTEVIIKNNSKYNSCQDVLDKIQDYTLSFDVESRKCHDKGFKIIDDMPDNSEDATMKIAEMLQNITKGVDKCIANTNALSVPLINWLPIWVRNICADCLEKMLQEVNGFKSKAEALCKEELDNTTMTTAINTCKSCHQEKANKLPQFTIAFELEMIKCRNSELGLSTPAASTTQSSTASSTTQSSTTVSSTTGSSTTGSSTTGSSTTGSSTTGSSTTGSSTTGSSTTGSSTTGSSTTGSSTTGSSTTGSSTTVSSTTGSSTTGSSTTGSSTTESSTTGSSTTGSSTTGSSTTGSSTTGSSTTGSSTTGSSTTESSTTGSSTTGSSTTGSSTTGSSTTESSTTGSSTTGSSTTGSSTTESSTTGSSTTGSITTESSTTDSSTTGSSTTGSSTTESSTTGSSTTGSSTTGSSTTDSSTTGSSTTEPTTTDPSTTLDFCVIHPLDGMCN